MALLTRAVSALASATDAPVVLIVDALQLSGLTVFRHFLHRFAAARPTVCVLAADRSTVTSARDVTSAKLVILDAFSDPAGWAAVASTAAADAKGAPAAAASPAPALPRTTLVHLSGVSSALKAAMASAPANGTAKPAAAPAVAAAAPAAAVAGFTPLFIDCLGELLLRGHTPAAVSQWLALLSASGFGPVVALLHADVVSDNALAALTYSAQTCITTRAPLQADAAVGVEVVYRRPSGKVSRSIEDVYPLVDGTVKCVVTGVQLKRPAASAAPAAASGAGAGAGASGAAASAADPTANLPFNLRLTDKQRADRDTVALPFAHRGVGVAKTMFTVGDMKAEGADAADAVAGDGEAERGMGQATTSDGDDDDAAAAEDGDEADG